MKILCFADTHAGVKNYGRIDKETGMNEREIQTLKLLDETVMYAIDHKVDCVVFAGDMYHKNMPSPTLVNGVNEIMVKLSQNRIKTFILDGNHDVSKMETFESGLKQFNTLQIPYFTHSRFYKEEIFECNGNEYRFVFLPTYHTKEEISDYMDKLDDKYPTFIIFHGSIKDAMLNDWNSMDGKTSIDKEVFNKPNILGVIMGHFHKHQILQEKPFIFYTGSTNRIDFTEEKQKKGFVELGVNDTTLAVSHRFVELTNAQKFLTIQLDCTDMTTAEQIEKSLLKEINSSDLTNVILRIRLNMTENIILDEKKILEFAYNKGVYYMLKIQKILPNVEAIVEDGISNMLSIQDSLEKYFDGTKRKNERVTLGMDIVRSVDECM
jgi:exonuclease SbcD